MSLLGKLAKELTSFAPKSLGLSATITLGCGGILVIQKAQSRSEVEPFSGIYDVECTIMAICSQAKPYLSTRSKDCEDHQYFWQAVLNSLSANASFSDANRRGRPVNSRSLVMMWCATRSIYGRCFCFRVPKFIVHRGISQP